MSIKITFDNNFLDKLVSLKDKRLKEHVIGLFKKKRLLFYPNIEMLSELLGLARTKRQHLLKIYAEIILQIAHHRVLNVWNRVLLSELGIMSENIFVKADIVKKFEIIFEDLAAGSIPKNVVQLSIYIEQEKDKRFKKNLELQRKHFSSEKEFFSELKKKNLRIKKPKNFKEFYELDSSKNLRFELIKDILQRAGRTITDSQIHRVLGNYKRYPYLHTMLKSNIALVYRHIVLREKVDCGDDYDFKQIIYLASVDYLISNDKRITKLAQDVFTETERVLKFEDFLELAKTIQC